jgi:hypothetical protein
VRHSRKPSCFKFSFHFDVARLRADLETALSRRWSDHHKRIHYDTGWNGLALRSISGGALDLKASRHDEFQNTKELAGCAYFREVVDTCECPVTSVRLLRLEMGAQVRTHVDDGLGYDFGMIRVHVPIVTHPGVRFVVAGRRLELREGEAWYVDTSYPHSVANLGDKDRVHLVLDCIVDDWLRAQFPEEFQRDMTFQEHVAGYARAYVYEAVDALRLLQREPRTFFRKAVGRVSRLGLRAR